MDESVIKTTQESLGTIIKKPPMTEKLLSKPPFRFLHDIMTAVIRTTGFLNGLYTDEEMNSDNVKDKEAKMMFLQKVIDAVMFINGKQLSVKTSKIVSGHEPEKTNEFLQALAVAINSGVSSDEAVQKVLNGEKPQFKEKREKKRSEKDRKSDETKDKEKHRRKDEPTNKDKVTNKDRQRDHGDLDRERKKRSKDKDRKENGHAVREKSAKGKGTKENKHSDRERTAKDRKHEERENKHGDKERKHSKKEVLKEDKEEIPPLHKDSPPIHADVGLAEGSPTPRPSTAKGSRRKQSLDDTPLAAENNVNDQIASNNNVVNQDEDIIPQQVLASRPIRPSSARPPPPRIAKPDTAPEELTGNVGSGKVENLIVDDGKASDDDDDNFVVETAPPESEFQQAEQVEQDDAEHGQLMQKIIAAKKQEENESLRTPTKIERETSGLSKAARLKERQLVEKEIEKLRESIQALTRSAMPLGKIMDYIQEDMDSMQKELDMWREENKMHSLALKREQNVTETMTEPLKAELVDLDQQINDMLDRISTYKSNIIKNDEKIHKMISSR